MRMCFLLVVVAAIAASSPYYHDDHHYHVDIDHDKHDYIDDNDHVPGTNHDDPLVCPDHTPTIATMTDTTSRI